MKRFFLTYKVPIIVLVLFILLGIKHIVSTPLDFDASLNMQVALNLAQSGEYRTSYKIHPTDYALFNPVITTGPTVIVPVALFFKIFGIGYLSGSVAMFFYLLALFSIFYLLYRRVLKERANAAFLFLTIVLLSTRMFLFYSLHVLGEIPSTFFFFLGIYLWGSLEDRSTAGRWVYVGAGLLMGLSIVTKLLSLLIVPPLIAVALMDIFFLHRIKPTRYLFVLAGMVIPLVAWEVIKMAGLGFHEYISYNMRFMRGVAGPDTGSGISARPGTKVGIAYLWQNGRDHFSFLVSFLEMGRYSR